MKFLSLAAALILSAMPALARDDKEALLKATEKAAALESYAFKGETDFQGPLGKAPAQIPVLDGKFQKDAGLHIKSDRGEIFKKNNRAFLKQGSEDWQDLAQFQPPPGGNPNRNRGAMFGPMMARNMKAPHEELKELAKGLKEVKKDEKTEKVGDIECVVYSGDLTDEAMKGSPLGRLIGQFGGAGAEVKGSAKFWVDLTGNVVIYEVLTKAAVEFQGNSIDFTLTRRNEISDSGKVKVEIPEGVQKLLSEKPKTEDKQ